MFGDAPDKVQTLSEVDLPTSLLLCKFIYLSAWRCRNNLEMTNCRTGETLISQNHSDININVSRYETQSPVHVRSTMSWFSALLEATQ